MACLIQPPIKRYNTKDQFLIHKKSIIYILEYIISIYFSIYCGIYSQRNKPYIML